MKLIIVGLLGLGLIPFFSACSTTCASRVPVAVVPPPVGETHQIVIRHSRIYDQNDDSFGSPTISTNTNSFHQHWSFREKNTAGIGDYDIPIHGYKVKTNSEIYWTVKTGDASKHYNATNFTLIFSDTNAWALPSGESWRTDIKFPKANYGAVDAIQIINADKTVVEWCVGAKFKKLANTKPNDEFRYWVAVPAIVISQNVTKDTNMDTMDTPVAIPLLPPFCFDLVDSSMVWPGDSRPVVIGGVFK